MAAGAFGAHALKARVSAESLATYQTGVQYHLIHSLALLAVAWAATRFGGSSTAPAVAGWAFATGIVLFSGSLYLLALVGVRQLGWITPVGGVAFLVGWLALGWAGIRN